VSAQVAISLVLLTSASLFARSFWKLERQPLGYQPDHLITASFTLHRQQSQAAAAQAALFRRIEDRLKAIPGSGLFGLSDSIPPRGSMGRPYSNIRIAGHRPVAAGGGMVQFRWITPGYFRVMEIPIVAGRPFEETDRGSGPSPLILSETLARRLFGRENPVGQQLDLEGEGHWCPIVGVAADTRNNGLTETDPEYYRLRMDNSGLPRTGVALVRTSLDPAVLAQWIRTEMATVDPSLPVMIGSMETRVAAFREQPRFLTWVVASFAAFGILLAAVGLYGVLSFLVAQQTQEIGVRMALGARPRDIVLQVQRRAGLWTALGGVIGFAGSLVVARMVKGLLIGIAPYDPVSLIASVLLLGVTAIVAAWLPSRRASRVYPMAALRYE
jgi:predicted permease